MNRFLLIFVVLMPSLVLGQGGPPAMVEVQIVKREALAISRPLVASVEAVTRSLVASELAGRIAKREFDDGQSVEAGQLLASLDVELLEADKLALQANVQASEAQVRNSRTSLENAQTEFARQKELFERKASPEKELRDASTLMQLADSQVAVSEATLSGSKAQLARLELSIRKASVTSPFAGVIARRAVEVGQWVDQGALIAEVVQLDPVYVVANVPESLLPQIVQGAQSKVTFDALPGETFEATVQQLMPEADMGSRTVRVRLQMANPGLRVRPGFFARVTFLSSTQVGTVIPKDAIVSSSQGTTVMLFKDGVAAPMPVKIVSGLGAEVAVEGGLKPGDMVVTRGNETLMPGQMLIPMNLGPPPGTGPAEGQAPDDGRASGDLPSGDATKNPGPTSAP